ESINENSELVVSAQILNEIYVNLLKHKVAEKNIISSINSIVDSCNQLVSIDLKLLQVGWELKQTYKLSYWDSLVAAAAFLSDCKILYSEDMQDGLVINKKLKIKNPLIHKG
ncbi:MAG TPA: PIN domain-containing protein, partial [Leptospiraceae bacterium]|nr:PIN domain-containing protein [Leptospiraceae bacterium]